MGRPEVKKSPKQIKFEKVSDHDLFSNLSGLMEGSIKATPRTKGRVQLELSPNAVVFIESSKYLDGPKLNYPQFEVVRDFWELLCPKCNDVQRIRERRDIPREDQVLLEYDTCPKCGYNKKAHFVDATNYNELVGVVGMRGGKSVLVSCMSSYLIHRILCVDNLQERLGLVRNQEIDGAFVAASSEQASETIYGLFRGFYENSPWFQHYKKSLMDLEIMDPDLRRGDLYWETERSIHFKDKHIRIKSLTSNSSSLAGRTRIFGIIDELSRMDAGESRRGAAEVYRVLKRSLVTISAAVARARIKGEYDLPDAVMFSISSPMFEDDKAMTLLKQAGKSERMFSFHRATWEFNPAITKEDLAEEYELDPVGAERDYGANPPGAENPLVVNPNIIEVCIDKDRRSTVQYQDEFFDHKAGIYTFNYIKPRILEAKFKNLNEYVLHCDPGEKSDSFCLAIGHLDGDVVVIDAAIECRPIKKNNRQGMSPREVFFPALTDIVLDISKKTCLRYVSYDRWNSTEQIQRLREGRVAAFKKDINRDDYVRFVNSLANNKVRLPDRENETNDPSITRGIPCSKALYELKRLSDDGVRVDHPPGGSSDMIQCYVGVHRLLTHPEDVINMNEMKKYNRNRGASLVHRRIGKVVRLPRKGIPR